jgi:5-enolpyruvylshikimate-3-phosphate synthase
VRRYIEGSDYCVITPPASGVINSGIDIDTYDDHRMAMAFSLAACGRGVTENKHSTDVESIQRMYEHSP